MCFQSGSVDILELILVINTSVQNKPFTYPFHDTVCESNWTRFQFLYYAKYFTVQESDWTLVLLFTSKCTLKTRTNHLRPSDLLPESFKTFSFPSVSVNLC